MQTKQKNCSICGSAFSCGATESDGKCWCNDFPKIMPLDFSLDCRCPECLKKVIQEKINEFIVSNRIEDKKNTSSILHIPKALFCWSGGKDSAYCLHKVLSEKLYDVRYLLTTVNANYNRISMHGVREELLEIQAESIGIKLLKVKVSEGTNSEYEKQMEATLLKAKAEGIEHIIFGDIFLDDLRAYREKNLEKVGMQAIFPLWKLNTKWLINDFITKGFKTITCCVNDEYLNEHWVGKEIDQLFIEQLPENVDPCGENGEFHTFCYEGPLFKKKISFSVGEKVYKPMQIKNISSSDTKGFWFCDLILTTEQLLNSIKKTTE